MTKISLRHMGHCLLVTVLFSAGSFAQKYEVHPLVGRTIPTKWADKYSLKSVSTVGVKAAAFADSTTQVEAEFQYLPHFEFRGTDPEMRAFVWGISASRNVFLKTKAIPFFNFGLGGVTARIGSPGSYTTTFPDRTITIDNNDTFLSLNYGAGVKAYNLMGPVGLRVNVLGRTMPNFFGRGNSWAEITGGLVFAFGEK